MGSDVVMTLGGSGEAVCIMEAGVKPLGRIRRPHLPGQHETQLIIERLGVLIRVEVPVGFPPMSPASGETVKNLASIPFAS